MAASAGSAAPASVWSAIEPFISAASGIVLDGGLATTLESYGHKLHSTLWSAELLGTEAGRASIARVHREALDAGADIITTSSYQSSMKGMMHVLKLTNESDAAALMRSSVTLACDVRDRWWVEYSKKQSTTDNKSAATTARQRPLVAVSAGCYGATLANGAEYTGDYGSSITADDLVTFHQSRLQVLLGDESDSADAARADLIAFETIPNAMEVRAIVRVCEWLAAHAQYRQYGVWISMVCKLKAGDEKAMTLSSGELLSDAVAIIALRIGAVAKSTAATATTATLSVAPVPNIIGVGVNCTPPQFVTSCLATIHTGFKSAPASVRVPLLLCYPNSGECWDSKSKSWTLPDSAATTASATKSTAASTPSSDELMSRWKGWIHDWQAVAPPPAHAMIIGGCCRTDTRHIALIRSLMHPSK